MNTRKIFGPARGPRNLGRVAAWVLLILVFCATAGGGFWMALHGKRPAPSAAPAPPKAVIYQCPMHPNVTSDHPGNCPICGMKLVPIRSADQPSSGQTPPEQGHGAFVQGLATVSIEPDRQRAIGLSTAAVTRGPVSAEWKTVARIQVDPTRVRKTNLKMEGFVERIFINFVGQPVHKGQALFSLYSPSLLSAQNELVLALETRDKLQKGDMLQQSGDDLVAAAKAKLALWDVPGSEIESIEKTRRPTRTILFVSPISGVVTAKNIVEGSRVAPGDTPYEITDLSVVWALADVYESDIARVRVGMAAVLTLAAYPSESFKGRVSFLDPILDPATRTAKVRVECANAKGRIMPGMFGDVALTGSAREGLRVPSDAVVRTGQRDVVFLALPDHMFQPKEVRLGQVDGDMVEVTEGLAEGQMVVTRANFLIDSESRLRASLSAAGGQGP